MFELPFNPPVQKLEGDEWTSGGVEVFIKREDLIHPFVSGNKWRKLKYVFAEAKTQGKTKLVSFGGAYSNHLVALACAGAMYGFKTVALVRGETVNNHMLSLCKTWGMDLHFVSREAYQNKPQLFQELYGGDNSCMMIDEGGRGALAMQGCKEILDGAFNHTHVCCAVGTGTTLAGLALAASEKKISAEGFCVLKGAEGITEEVSNMLNGGVDFQMHHRFHFGGYGKSNQEVMTFITLFASSTGILLDHVYTAKMMMGIQQLIKESYYPKGSKILAIHTGGLLGLLSQFD